MTRQTTIWFNDEDWALIDFVQAQNGLRSRADAIRLAIRQAARLLGNTDVPASPERKRRHTGEEGVLR